MAVELVFSEVRVTHQHSATLGRGWSETMQTPECVLIAVLEIGRLLMRSK